MQRRPTTRASRRIAADPTSTALLLAGPTAVELWPGARRLDDADGHVVVEMPALDGGDQPSRVAVRALPPRRTPTSYVTRFEWTADDLPPASGRLTLAYAPTADGTPVTHAVLELDVPADGPYGVRALEVMAEGFLENLARAAEMRNRAA